MALTLLQPCVYRLSLRPARRVVERRFVLVLAVVLAAGVLGVWTARAGLSAWAIEHPNRDSLALALAWDPANAELHHRLGLLLLYQASFENWEFQYAHDVLERSAALAPQNATIWTDLAFACDLLGDSAGARRALERALALDPMTPTLQRFAANFYARVGDTERSFRHFRRLLELDPTYAPAAFEVGARLAGDPALLEARLMPAAHQPQLRLALLSFLTAAGRLDLAHHTWQAIRAARMSFPFALVQPYLERLIAAGDVEQTAHVWHDLARLGVVPASAAEPGNGVFNGNFEQPPLGGGLDWRWSPQRGVWLDFADRGAYRGERSLRVDFVDERNEQYELVAQIVPVTAGQSYRLSAWARSEAITSDSGPRLRVSDPDCSGCPVADTAMLTGTSPWQRLEAGWTARPAQRFARISLWRARSRTFPTQISGHFWLDAVSLKAAGSVRE